MDRCTGFGGTRLKRADQVLYDQLDQALTKFISEQRDLPGIATAGSRDSLVRQLVDSVHRVRYPSVIRSRNLSQNRKDPSNEMFDPIKAAVLHFLEGNIDEASWLVFLFAHFGRHRKTGYLYAASVYGRLGQGGLWDWVSTTSDPSGFRKWLHDNRDQLDALPAGFGNHRKYESLDAYSKSGTGETVDTYVEWVKPPRSHQQVFEDAISHAGGDPKKAFHVLYESMSTVSRFGRLARFDYLAMIGKLGIALIEPGSAYMASATGPINGAKLLLAGSSVAKISTRELDDLLTRLDAYLNVGNQALEDAVCNWQKSPGTFKPFRG